jgi:hypothetical protein
MDFFDQAELGTKVGEAEGADFCGKNYGFLREVSQKSAKVRTDQARKSAIVRIFTGETNFSIRKAGNKENKNGKEGGLTTDGHE